MLSHLNQELIRIFKEVEKMKALILLGCPETPSQTPMSIYAAYKLAEKGYDVTIAANPAASKLVKVSDPKNIIFMK